MVGRWQPDSADARLRQSLPGLLNQRRSTGTGQQRTVRHRSFRSPRRAHRVRPGCSCGPGRRERLRNNRSGRRDPERPSVAEGSLTAISPVDPELIRLLGSFCARVTQRSSCPRAGLCSSRALSMSQESRIRDHSTNVVGEFRRVWCSPHLQDTPATGEERFLFPWNPRKRVLSCSVLSAVLS